MFAVSNTTPFVLGTFVLPDTQGADSLILVVKGTFDVSRTGVAVAKEQRELVLADEYWGEPGASSLKYASEVHLPKSGSDVVLVGSAHAPNGQPVPQFGFSLSVGNLKKVIYVFGDRTFTRFGGATSPVPTLKVPLTYERAYGGQHLLANGKVLNDPRNPVGCGFRGERSASEMAKRPYPNLFDPTQASDAPSDRMTPAGVGYVAPGWEPRISRAGTYGPAWLKNRSPFLPEDFDPRFLHAASAGLIAEGRLRGGEPVEIINGAPPPHAVQRFVLPRCRLGAEVQIGSKKASPPLFIDTLLLDPEASSFSMVWIGSVPCHNQATRIEQLRLFIESADGLLV